MTDELSRLYELADLVLAIEQAMRGADYWHDDVPSPAAMASRTPFCADTLAFSEWLQFIFIPRMRALIEDNAPMPQASAIAPLAEEALAEQPGKQAVVDRLRAFDQAISGA
ncbi:protein YqcC [Salinisphaera sp. T5B8]|uniref:YqcC family protein n=1 Tax=unclassified Salinisphaera TaxID=2649847 RepID=UPI00333FEC0B